MLGPIRAIEIPRPEAAAVPAQEELGACPLKNESMVSSQKSNPKRDHDLSDVEKYLPSSCSNLMVCRDEREGMIAVHVFWGRTAKQKVWKINLPAKPTVSVPSARVPSVPNSSKRFKGLGPDCFQGFQSKPVCQASGWLHPCPSRAFSLWIG